MKKTKIAIVGAGLAGTILLKRLVRKLPTCFNTYYQIDVFEAASETGPGIAYVEESEELLLNRTTSKMYAYCNGDFLQWMSSMYGSSYKAESLSTKFLPRRYFGEFLNKVFKDTIAESKLRNINVHVYNQNITDVVEVDGGFKFKTCPSTSSTIYRYVFITTGNDINSDHYGLRGFENYYSSPYPLSKFEKLSKSTGKNIGIVGSRLCASDIASHLIKNNPSVKLTMLSRSGKLPRPIRSSSKPHKFTKFTHAAIHKLVKENSGFISLDNIRQLLQEEFNAHCPGLSVEQLFKNNEPQIFKNNTAYKICSSLNHEASLAWQFLYDREKNIFLRRFSSIWIHFRIGIPIDTHELISQHQVNKMLKVQRGLKSIVRSDDAFLATFADGSQETFDTIVNATGIKRRIDNTSPLLTRILLLKNICQINRFGGVRVDNKNCSVLVDNLENPNFKIIGQLTCGDFYMVNNVDTINMQVKAAADDVCKRTALEMALAHEQIKKQNTA